MLNIKRAHQTDLATVQHVVEELLKEEGEFSEENKVRSMANISTPSISDHCVFLAFHQTDGVVGGFLGSISACRDSCIGIGTWVRKDHRSQGIATELRRRAKGFLKTAGVPVITGFIRVDNKEGLNALPHGAKLTHHFYEIRV